MKPNLDFGVSMVIFSFLYWFDFFFSLGKAEMNPLYSTTGKFILFPILITGVLVLQKFWSPKLKFATVFLISLFAFAMVWNVAGVYADNLVNRIDSGHQGTQSNVFNFFQRIPDSVEGSIITGFTFTTACRLPSPSVVADGHVLRINSLGNVTEILGNTSAVIPNGGISADKINTNFTFPTNVTLTPSLTDSYVISVNTTQFCNATATERIFFYSKSGGGVDTPNENAFTVSQTWLDLSPTFIGMPVYSGTQLGTSSYSIQGVLAEFSNQTSISTCNSVNGADCSSTTTELTFPLDCTANSMVATVTHNLNLFNGTTQPQYATATTQFIKPASNQFTNITTVNWTNQASRNLDLTFTRSTNYNAGDIVQATCALSMTPNITSGISTCTLVTYCVRGIETQTQVNNTLTENLFGQTNTDLSFQMLQLFLSPFMILTLVAFGIAGLITGALNKAMEGHGGIVFVSILFVLFFAYTVVGVYPIYVGIVMILVIGLILTKMVMGFFKGD